MGPPKKKKKTKKKKVRLIRFLKKKVILIINIIIIWLDPFLAQPDPHPLLHLNANSISLSLSLSQIVRIASNSEILCLYTYKPQNGLKLHARIFKQKSDIVIVLLLVHPYSVMA